MAGLSEILDRVRGKKPEEEEKIRRDAEAARLESEKTTGPQEEEEGLEEESSPADIIKPYKQAALDKSGMNKYPLAAAALDMAIPDSPLPFMQNQASKAMSQEGRLARMAGRMPSRRATPISKASPELRQQAYRDSKIMDSVNTDLKGAEETKSFVDKAYRKGAQDQSDLQSRVKKAGGDISEGPALDYSEINKIEKKPESPFSYDYKEMNKPQAAPASGSLTYTKNSGQNIKQMQDQMADLMSQGKYTEARDLQKRIREAREGTNVGWSKPTSGEE